MKTLPPKQPRSRLPRRNTGVRRQRITRTTRRRPSLPDEPTTRRFPRRNTGIRRQRTSRTSTAQTRRRPYLLDEPAILETVEPNHRLVQVTARRARRRTLRQLQDQDIPVERRRPVVCDGESLAYNEVSQAFDADRIRAAVELFEQAGHTAVVIIPTYLRGRVSNGHVLENLLHHRRLIVVECQRPGTAQFNVELERELLEKAVQEEAAVVSEREFRSIYFENTGFREIIDNRVIGFCFFKSEIFIPVDPYGRYGPLLRHILQK